MLDDIRQKGHSSHQAARSVGELRMETLGLFAVLLAIVLIGFLAIHIAITIAGIVLEFIENNLLKVVTIALIVLALWISQH